MNKKSTRKRKLLMLQVTMISTNLCLHHHVFTKKNQLSTSNIPKFSLQAAIIDLQDKVYVDISEYIYVKSRHASSTRVRRSYVTSEINNILEPH